MSARARFLQLAIALCAVPLLSAVTWAAPASPAKSTAPVTKNQTKAGAGKEARELPSAKDVRRVWEKQFLARKGYRRGDLASQADWDAMVAEFERLGWKPVDAAEIRNSLLGEKSFLIQQSRTPAGRKFFEQVARYPQGLDRLEHLARIPNGEMTIRRLIQGPDGYRLLEYMTTAPGGIELGKMLSRDPGGQGFNQPTGRIYSAEQLLTVIEASLAKSQAGGQTAVKVESPRGRTGKPRRYDY